MNDAATATAPKRLSIRRHDARENVSLMRVVDLVRTYRQGRQAVPVLKGVNLSIDAGSFTAIVGKSGSGKSTLLHLLGSLDRPDGGEIWFRQERLDRWTPAKKDRYRNRDVGMVFQFYHLLPELTTLENVLVPRMIQHSWLQYRWRRKEYTRRAEELLALVGLEHRKSHKPNELSGGEMQRAAIARALIAQPSLLLADEPTGNLDSESGREVMDALLHLRDQRSVTIVMVTHDDNIAAAADRVIQLKDGVVQTPATPRAAAV